MSRFCEIVFCAPLLYRRHVCSSNLKHSPSRELPLTARKTVFSHLKYTKFKPLQKPTTISVSTWSIIISQITTIENNGSFEGWKDKLVNYSCDRLEDENMYEHYFVVLGHFVKKSPGKNWRFKGLNGIKRVVSNAIIYIRHNILWYLHRLRSNCLI